MTTAALPTEVHPLMSREISPGGDRLAEITQAVTRGRRLSVEDGLVLYETSDLWAVLALV